MKNLLKLPLLLITLLLIFSCGRNAEADVNTIEDTIERFEFLDSKERTKEVLEEGLGLFLEAEEIFSYYVNDANDDEASSFIKLLNKVDEFESVNDRKDLSRFLGNIKREIEDFEEALDEM